MVIKENVSPSASLELLGEEILCQRNRKEDSTFFICSAFKGEGVELICKELQKFFNRKIPNQAYLLSEKEFSETFQSEGDLNPEKALLDGLKRQYPLILIPGNGLLEDNRLMPYAFQSDAAILVIRAGVTDRINVHRVVEILLRYEVKILGAFLAGSLGRNLNIWITTLWGWVLKLFGH